MAYPRHTQICLKQTPYYHVVSRCVRRAWLWGFDEYAGKDYSHRKDWVLERLRTLAEVFAIDIAAFAILSNHYHLVLHVDQVRAQSWTAEEVVGRWTALFGTPDLILRLQSGLVTDPEREAAAELIALWRARLSDISWYMRCLNEHLAKRANEEDNCSGRFWEGRFKSQALLDEAGLLTAMAYVDLNPVRAGIAATPEGSEFTSIYQRILELKPAVKPPTQSQVPLFPFRDASPSSVKSIPFVLRDYLELVDWTGKHITNPSKASIAKKLPTILSRLRIKATPWAGSMRPSGNHFGRALGRVGRLRTHAWNLGHQWIHGMGLSKRLFGAE